MTRFEVCLMNLHGGKLVTFHCQADISGKELVKEAKQRLGPAKAWACAELLFGIKKLSSEERELKSVFAEDDRATCKQIALEAIADCVQWLHAQMSKDAFDCLVGECPDYKELSQLFDGMKDFKQTMVRRSLRAKNLIAACCSRLPDAGLRLQCAKLIEKLPDKVIEKYDINNASSDDELWAAIARLASRYCY